MKHLEAVAMSFLMKSHLFCPYTWIIMCRAFYRLTSKEGKKKRQGNFRGQLSKFISVQLNGLRFIEVCPFYCQWEAKIIIPVIMVASYWSQVSFRISSKIMTRAVTLKPVSTDYAELTLILRCSIYIQYGLYFKIKIIYDCRLSAIYLVTQADTSF